LGHLIFNLILFGGISGIEMNDLWSDMAFGFVSSSFKGERVSSGLSNTLIAHNPDTQSLSSLGWVPGHRLS